MRAQAQITISNLSDGKDGKGIKSTDIKYQVSDSGTVAPTGTWSPTIPSVPAGKYLWTRTILTYTDNKTDTAYSVSKVGDTGATGKGIKSITTEYAISSSKIIAPSNASDWKETKPEWSKGMYLWIRSKIVYQNPASTEYTVPYCDTTWEAVDNIKLGTKNLIHNAQTMVYTDYQLTSFSGTSVFSVDDTTLKISSVTASVDGTTLKLTSDDATVDGTTVKLGGK